MVGVFTLLVIILGGLIASLAAYSYIKLGGAVLIFYYELNNQPKQLIFILVLYVILTTSSWVYSRGKKSL